MSRNVNETMQKIFDVLKESIEEDDISRIEKTHRHIIADGNETTVVDFVKKSKIKAVRYTQETIIAFLYNARKYVLISSSLQQEIEQLGLDFESDNSIIQGAGMIAISEKCLNLKKEITSIRLIDECFGVVDEIDPDNVSFKFSQISQLYESYSVVRIDENRIQLQYVEDFNRFYGLIFPNLATQTTHNTASRLKQTLLQLSSRSISASIISCLESQLIEYSFLQLYQCLEYLFIVNSGISISDSHDISKETAIDIITKHQLKASEKENLYHVLKKNAPDIVIDLFYNEFKDSLFVGEQEPADKYQLVSNFIYKIRCNIAHLRYNQEVITVTQWVDLVDVMSEIVYAIYEKMDDDITYICMQKNVWENVEWTFNS